MNHSPYARFRLFRNPFGELTIAERAELAVVDLDKYMDWLEHAPRAALQVIGPCGHGKSTHLRALQYAWAARHSLEQLPAWVYFSEDGDQPALPRSRPVFIDEAQRMSWWRRRQMLATAGPLVIGSHRDLTQPLQAAGFQTLLVDLDQPMAPERLQQILNRRIQMSALPICSLSEFDEHGARATEHTELAQVHSDRASLCLTMGQVVALQQRFGSNIRQMEEYLYQRFQGLVLKGEPWLPAD